MIQEKKFRRLEQTYYSLFSFGIFREPTFLNAFFLFDDFTDGPEVGESKDAEYCGKENGLHIKRDNHADKAEHKEDPPTFFGEIVLAFDYDRMVNADNEKGNNTCQ